MLKLGESSASQEYRAHRRSCLVIRQIFTSVLAVTRSVSSVLQRKDSQ